MAKVTAKPASGIGYGKAFRSNASGLVKPKGFDAEFNAKPQHSAGVVTPNAAPINPGLPWDGIAEGQAATAGASYKNSINQTAANRAIGLQEFGIDAGYDDYKNNPFSQAALLQHNHESNARGINTTAGQALYSGQTGNAQTIESGRTNQAHQGIVNEDERAKAGWLAEEKAAEIAQQESITAAQEGAVERASAAPGPEVPLNEPAQPKPASAPAGKKWVKNSSGHWHLVKA